MVVNVWSRVNTLSKCLLWTANCGLRSDHERPATFERPLLVSSPTTNEILSRIQIEDFQSGSSIRIPSAGGEDTKPAAGQFNLHGFKAMFPAHAIH
jgi:hypothetical protein